MNPEELEELILRAGGRPTPDILTELDEAVDELAIHRAAEVIRQVARSLEKTTAGRALERALLGADQSLEADARELEVSKQALHKHQNAIERRLRLTIQPMGRKACDL